MMGMGMGCSKRGIVQPSCSAENNHVDAAPEQLSNGADYPRGRSRSDDLVPWCGPDD